MICVATWNVNSIKARVGVAAAWLEGRKPDVLLMQEIKCSNSEFPRGTFEKMGFNVEVVGQRSHNGVAILSGSPLRVEHRRVPGRPHGDLARYIEAVIETPSKGKKLRGTLRVASIYVPNGNPVGSEQFAYKIDWMTHLVRHARGLLKRKEVLVLGGDYNVAPTDIDVYDPVAWANDALCRPETRAKFRELLSLGLTDAIATSHPEPENYTFWDYQAQAWPKNHGLRIDHILLSAQAMSALVTCGIDKQLRGKSKPSDHVPVWCELQL
jgi:exodeoxyribonuclease-3